MCIILKQNLHTLKIAVVSIEIPIPNSPNIPVQELENRIDELKIYQNKNIIVYCRSGNRSKTGTEILNNNGCNAVNLIGGMKQWKGPKISKG